MLNKTDCNLVQFTNLLIINNIPNSRLHDYRITPLFLNTHFLNCMFIHIYILLYIYLYIYKYKNSSEIKRMAQNLGCNPVIL